MLNINLSEDTLAKTINGLEFAIALLNKRIDETYSGVDAFMLNSAKIETEQALATLKELKPEPKAVVFNYATPPEG